MNLSDILWEEQITGTRVETSAGRRRAWVLLLALVGLGVGVFLEDVHFKFLLMVFFGAVGGAIISLPYAKAIQVLFLYLGVEGALKILTHYNVVIHVGSDLLVISLCFRWFISFLLQKTHLPKVWPPFLVIFLMHLAWFFIEFANPYSLGLVASLAGAKVYVVMLTLYFFGFYLTDRPATVKNFFLMWVLVALVQMATSLYQGAIGPSSVLSITPYYQKPLDMFKGYAFRPFGTTALPGGAAVFIYLAFVFTIYFLFRSTSKLFRIILLASLPGILMALILCQVRAQIIKCILGTGIFIFFILSKSAPEIRRKAMVLIPATALVLVLALPKFTDHWIETRSENSAALKRSLTAFDLSAARSARKGALDRIIAHADLVPLGAGLSRGGSAVNQFMKEVYESPFFNFPFFGDNFWATTIAEIGIPGSLIITALILFILIRGFASAMSCSNIEIQAQIAAIAASLSMIVVGLWGAEGLLYNPEAPFFWFFSGVLMRLPLLATNTEVTSASGARSSAPKGEPSRIGSLPAGATNRR